MKAFKEAEQINRQTGNLYLLSECLHNEGTILVRENLFEEALKLYKEEEKISIQIGNPEGIGFSLQSQSLIFLVKNDQTEMEKVYNKSYTIAKQYNYAGLLNALKFQGILFSLYSSMRIKYLFIYIVEFILLLILKIEIFIIFMIIAATILFIFIYQISRLRNIPLN